METQRIQEKYGYYDTFHPNSKYFQGEVSCKHKRHIGKEYRFQLKVDRVTKRIYLLVFNRFNRIIDSSSYWSFSILEEKLTQKLKYLAFIEANRKVLNSYLYFKYQSLKVYGLKDFETFIELIEQDKILIRFSIGGFRTGKRAGQVHDHGTSFIIKSSDIPLLFTRLK